jgi:hypothetical protein
MSTSTPLLSETIEPDDPTIDISSNLRNATGNEPRKPVILTPQSNAAATPSDLESGITGIFKQSSHPIALFFLYLFRTAAIAVYVFCGFFTDNYVLSTVAVVVLLSMDFWNCRNVAGRTLVGLRFWNQVDEDGESYWVFESRDPSQPANPIDSKLFWTALYVYPVMWIFLFIVSILKFNISFLPIVALALVFNVTNVIGFTYADRDAKQRWATSVAAGSWDTGFGLGGLGGQIVGGIVKQGVGRVFGA